MSRIGKMPISVPAGVQVTMEERTVRVKGPKGYLSRTLPAMTTARLEADQVVVERENESRVARSRHGLARTMVANMVEGVANGFKKDLQIEGVGFKALVQGSKVILSLGFASPKEFVLPADITVSEQGGTRLSVQGCSKELVGDVAARLRGFYPAEPYKGKGIRYVGEQVRRKVGKTVS